MQYHGNLEILAVEGKQLANRELFGKQDPYIKFQIDNQVVKSKTHINGGKNPSWNQTLLMLIVPGSTMLNLSVYDEDSVKDDLIGTGSVPLDTVFQSGSLDTWVELRSKKGNAAGKVRLILTFKSKTIEPVIAYSGAIQGQNITPPPIAQQFHAYSPMGQSPNGMYPGQPQFAAVPAHYHFNVAPQQNPHDFQYQPQYYGQPQFQNFQQPMPPMMYPPNQGYGMAPPQPYGQPPQYEQQPNYQFQPGNQMPFPPQ